MNAILILLLVALVVAISTVVFQILWNTTMPDVFNARKVTFWQSLRLLLLFGLVFGSTSFVQLTL